MNDDITRKIVYHPVLSCIAYYLLNNGAHGIDIYRYCDIKVEKSEFRHSKNLDDFAINELN